MRRQSSGVVLILGMALALAACGDDDGDGTTDPDMGLTLPETGTRDTGTPPPPPDGGGRDLGPTPPPPPDGGGDGSRPDSGPPPSCTTGIACTPARGCPGGDMPMIPSAAGSICVPEDVADVMAGGHTWTETSWQDGYCIDRVGTVGTPGACDPNTSEGCPSCGSCIGLFEDAMAGLVYGCVASCELTGSNWSMGNSGCRPGYACDLLNEVCFPGCSSDDECRATFTDANDNGMRDPGETAYDATSTATCDTTTFRCVNRPSTASGTAGSPCDADGDCEDDGFCIEDDPMDPSDWNNGYCTKGGCLLTGRECGGSDAICMDDEIGVATGICINSCTVGNEMDPFMPDNECPAGGYMCFPSDGGPDGGCVPGNYNATREPNLGSTCTEDSQCYSPFGQGRCLELSGQGFCIILGCDAAGYATDMSGPDGGEDSALCADGMVGGVQRNSFCVQLATDVFGCMQQCDPTPETPVADGGAPVSPCVTGMTCLSLAMDGGGDLGICFPRCRNDDDCGAGATCNRTTGACE